MSMIMIYIYYKMVSRTEQKRGNRHRSLLMGQLGKLVSEPYGCTNVAVKTVDYHLAGCWNYMRIMMRDIDSDDRFLQLPTYSTCSRHHEVTQLYGHSISLYGRGCRQPTVKMNLFRLGRGSESKIWKENQNVPFYFFFSRGGLFGSSRTDLLSASKH